MQTKMRPQQNSAELMWKNLLSSNGPEVVFVPKDEVDEVTALFIESRIDPEKFAGNLMVLLKERMPSGNDTQPYGPDNLPATPSIEEFLFFINRPPLVPLWFIAGFPDVLIWFGDQEADSNCEVYFTKLFGLSPEDLEDQTSEQYLSADDQLKVSYWRNLVTKYTAKTGKGFETAVQTNSANDPYLAARMFEATGEQNNCTLIASVVTQYYLELKQSFPSKIPDETSLLAMAGMLDAEYYISTRQLDPKQILSAVRATEAVQNRLLQFLIQFETLVLSCDNPQASHELIQSCCEEQSEAIRESIQRTMSSYQGNPSIARKVHTAMLSFRYREIRKVAGIQ